MADHVEVLRAMRTMFSEKRIPSPCEERDALDAAIRALSPAGGDLHHAVWSILRPYIQPAAREKVNAALKEILAASPQQEPGAGELCKTCGGHGVVCYHTGQTPEQYEEHTEDCPECTPSGQTLAGAGVLAEIEDHAGHVNWCADKLREHGFRVAAGALDETAALLRRIRPLTATSAGTTGDDSEDAARYRWLRTCGVADDRAIHTRGYSELLSESELDAAIDARRAREAGK